MRRRLLHAFQMVFKKQGDALDQFYDFVNRLVTDAGKQLAVTGGANHTVANQVLGYSVTFHKTTSLGAFDNRNQGTIYVRRMQCQKTGSGFRPAAGE
jgi:hypothetical protein